MFQYVQGVLSESHSNIMVGKWPVADCYVDPCTC